jgi:hypothetical protein
MISYFKKKHFIPLIERFNVIEESNSTGVYVIHVLNKNKLPKIINRLLDSDEYGILYIGQSTKQSMKTRIDFFKKVSNPDSKSTAHSGAMNFKEIKLLRDRFNLNSLYVTLHPHKTPKKFESELIEIYRQKFGEVPPLNGKK